MGTITITGIMVILRITIESLSPSKEWHGEAGLSAGLEGRGAESAQNTQGAAANTHDPPDCDLA